MAIWARDHSVPTPSKICTQDAISCPRTLAQVSERNYHRKRSFQFESNSRFEPFELSNSNNYCCGRHHTVPIVIYCFPLFPPASTHTCDSSFPISVSQNGIPNGIPSHTAIISVHEILMYPETKLTKLSFIATYAFTNLEVSLALVFHLAPRGFPSEVHLSFTSL